MRYLAKSADVLNEADRFQQILEWELFTSAQEHMLWGAYDPAIEWRPGDPLYLHPNKLYCHCPDCHGSILDDREEHVEIEIPINYHGHTVRPMIEEFDESEFIYPYSCEACEVGWDRYEAADCWNCGADFPKLDYPPIFTASYPPPEVAEQVGLDALLERALARMRVTNT